LWVCHCVLAIKFTALHENGTKSLKVNSDVPDEMIKWSRKITLR